MGILDVTESIGEVQEGRKERLYYQCNHAHSGMNLLLSPRLSLTCIVFSWLQSISQLTHRNDTHMVVEYTYPPGRQQYTSCNVELQHHL